MHGDRAHIVYYLKTTSVSSQNSQNLPECYKLTCHVTVEVATTKQERTDLREPKYTPHCICGGDNKKAFPMQSTAYA